MVLEGGLAALSNSGMFVFCVIEALFASGGSDINMMSIMFVVRFRGETCGWKRQLEIVKQTGARPRPIP
jgi:hypothetical protein